MKKLTLYYLGKVKLVYFLTYSLLFSFVGNLVMVKFVFQSGKLAVLHYFPQRPKCFCGCSNRWSVPVLNRTNQYTCALLRTLNNFHFLPWYAFVSVCDCRSGPVRDCYFQSTSGFCLWFASVSICSCFLTLVPNQTTNWLRLLSVTTDMPLSASVTDACPLH